MKKFEYLTFSVNFEKNAIYIGESKLSYTNYFNGLLELLGSQGWELISAVNNKNSVGVVSTNQIDYLFKRELNEIKKLSAIALEVKDILKEGRSTF